MPSSEHRLQSDRFGVAYRSISPDPHKIEGMGSGRCGHGGAKGLIRHLQRAAAAGNLRIVGRLAFRLPIVFGV